MSGVSHALPSLRQLMPPASLVPVPADGVWAAVVAAAAEVLAAGEGRDIRMHPIRGSLNDKESNLL
jgi:hypothetical protein